MAKETPEDQDLDIGQVYSKTELFLEENKSTVIGVVVGLVVLVGAILFWNNYNENKNIEAGSLIWKAEYWYEIDSLNLAINGNADFDGFEYFANEYSGTATGNLASYYLGSIYMKQGKFDLALANYENADVDDDVLSMMRVGGMGDANMELGNTEAAASQYMKAASAQDNEFLSPMFYFKAGIAYKTLNNKAKAKEAFTRVFEDYPNYRDAAMAKKYAVLYGA